MLNRVARDRVNHHSHHDKPKLHAVLSGRGVTQVSSYLKSGRERCDWLPTTCHFQVELVLLRVTQITLLIAAALFLASTRPAAQRRGGAGAPNSRSEYRPGAADTWARLGGARLSPFRPRLPLL
jgi:hypothetical protein